VHNIGAYLKLKTIVVSEEESLSKKVVATMAHKKIN